MLMAVGILGSSSVPECQRIDAFELWCWRRLLRALWTAGASNQSILKEVSPEYSLESKLHKTTSERWQRISGTQKSNPLSSKGGRTKYKR